MTGVGRVCGVSASSAPSATTICTSSSVRIAMSSSQNAAPAHVRLDAPDEDDVALAARRPGDRDARGRPLDPPADPADQGHRGPVDLEVVVVLGVERGQRSGVPDQLEVLDGPGRGVPGVVPALERDDHHRVVELGQVHRGGLGVVHLCNPTSIRRRHRVSTTLRCGSASPLARGTDSAPSLARLLLFGV